MQAQVVVVTGASAGVGRATARAFGARGARVALLARGRAGLEAAAAEVEELGGAALPLTVDVSDPAQVEAAADRVEREFGPIEVWVNNAFAGVFAPFDEVAPEDYRRVTEVTYLGTVNGTRAALARMKARNAGVIVQAGSALAYRGIPLQSAYCGAKHAIEGFTESLRAELIHDDSDVKVTMVQLPALNTPQFDWVRSHLPRRAQPVPPIYQPEVAARAILLAADHPQRRERWIGGSTVATLLAEKVVPGLLDRYLGRSGYRSQETGEQETDRPDNLWEPCDADRDHGAHGRFDDQAKPRSLLLAAQTWRSRGPLERSAVHVGGRRMVSLRRHPPRPAPPVVCVHGGGVSGRELHPLVESMGRHVDAWTVDLPGFGNSDKPAEALEPRELSDALAAWLEAQELGPVCLVGCSLGCPIAVDLTVRRPDLVGSLVLTGPAIDPAARTWPRLISRWVRDAVHEDVRMLPLYLAHHRDAGLRRALASFRAAMDDRIEDRLPHVIAPTLVVRGERDRIASQEWAEQVTRLLPHGRLAVVPGAPHMVPFSAPEELAALITEFVHEVPSAVG